MGQKSYCWNRPIAFGDVDLARILYYPNLFHYVHQAFEGFMEEALGFSYAVFLAEKKLGFPAVDLKATYEKPFPYGAAIYLEVQLIHLGTKSMRLRYVGRTVRNGARHAVAEVTTVLVNMDTFSALPIPDWIRAALLPYALSADEPGE